MNFSQAKFYGAHTNPRSMTLSRGELTAEDAENTETKLNGARLREPELNKRNGVTEGRR